MKRWMFAGMVWMIGCCLVGPAQARDDRSMTPFAEAMATPEAADKVIESGEIKFYFANQKAPPVAKELGQYISNQKTNAFAKKDEDACVWAFYSAMRSLKRRAIREGGDAVIDIHSYYKKNEIDDKSSFECGAGAFVAGVALRGTVVKLR